MGMGLDIQSIIVGYLEQERGWHSQMRTDRGHVEEVGSSRARKVITVVGLPPRGHSGRVTVGGEQWTVTWRIVDGRGPVHDGIWWKV